MDKQTLIIAISALLGLASGVLISAIAGVFGGRSRGLEEKVTQEKQELSEELGHELSKLRESLALSAQAYSNAVKVMEEKLPVKAELKKELEAPLTETLHIEHEEVAVAAETEGVEDSKPLEATEETVEKESVEEESKPSIDEEFRSNIIKGQNGHHPQA